MALSLEEEIEQVPKPPFMSMCARACRKGSTCSAHSHPLLPNRLHKECVSPHPLDNADRDERTL